MEFPDERGYEPSQDGTDLIRPGCSVPLNRLLGSLKEWATQDTTPRWSLFFVNAATVVRNVFNDSITYDQMRHDFASDMEQFTLYLDAYLSHMTPSGFRASVVLYFPDYSSIPLAIAREPSPKQIEQSKLYVRLMKQVAGAGPRLTSEGIRTYRWTVPCAKRTLPAHALVSWLHRAVTEKTIGTYRIGDPVALMTHCAVDLHMYRRLSKVTLWEYFTSVIKTPDRFGTKLMVPKGVDVPFTVLTHRLFGDRVHIKPEISGRLKTKLLESALDGRWMRYTDSQIFREAHAVNDKLTWHDLLSFRF